MGSVARLVAHKLVVSSRRAHALVSTRHCPRRFPSHPHVAERFNRTPKEQAVYGRVLRNAAEVRAPSPHSSLVTTVGGVSRRSAVYHPPTLAPPSLKRALRETNDCPENRVGYTRHLR